MFTSGVSFGGKDCLDPLQLREDCLRLRLPIEPWWGKANSFRCPLGGTPGSGVVLMRRADLEALDLNSSWPLAFQGPDGTRFTFARLTVRVARSAVPGREGDPDEPFWVELVDRRWLFREFRFTAGSYNVRLGPGTGDYLDDTMVSSTPWTWSLLAQVLWTDATGGLAFPGLPYAPDGTPEGFVFGSEPAWGALNDTLAKIHCEVRYDPEADSFAIVRLGDADANAEAETKKLRAAGWVWKSDPMEPVSTWRPAKVTVAFRRWPVPAENAVTHYTVDVNDPDPVAGQVAGSAVRLFDDMPALGPGTPSNAAALSTRATERATRWYAAAAYQGRGVESYEGIPAGLASLLGTFWGELSVYDRGGGVRCELAASPKYADRAKGWEIPKAPFSPAMMGKLDDPLTFEGDAVVSIWAWNGSDYADTGDDVTAYDRWLSDGDTLPTGSWVGVMWVGNRFHVFVGQCP